MKVNSADEPASFGPSTPFQDTSGNDSTFVGLDEDHLLRKYSHALRDWAWRYCVGNGELRNDLFQEGALGLFQAARRFDPAQGVKFSTLARRHMRGRMLNYLRSESCHRRCLGMAQACHQAEDHDAENPPQEDCLPIGATEALDQTERFLFEVDVNLLRGVMQQCLALSDLAAAGDFHNAVRGRIAAFGRCACARDFTGAGNAGVDGIHGEDTRRICEVMI